MPVYDPYGFFCSQSTVYLRQLFIGSQFAHFVAEGRFNLGFSKELSDVSPSAPSRLLANGSAPSFVDHSSSGWRRRYQGSSSPSLPSRCSWKICCVQRDCFFTIRQRASQHYFRKGPISQSQEDLEEGSDRIIFGLGLMVKHTYVVMKRVFSGHRMNMHGLTFHTKLPYEFPLQTNTVHAAPEQ